MACEINAIVRSLSVGSFSTSKVALSELSHGCSQVPDFKSDVDQARRAVSACWLKLQKRIAIYLKE